MKYTILSSLLYLSVLTACSDDNNLTIKVTEADDRYEFYARFDKQKTQRVQAFINSKLAPSSFTGDHIDVTTTLDDNTQFDLEESPGKVHIKLDKAGNSASSYHRIKTMCEGLKKVIEGKS